MPVRLPLLEWPAELLEEGPAEDPLILLSSQASIGNVPYRVLAVRINLTTLGVDYRLELDEDIYADYQLEEMLDELTFLDDLDKSVLVPMQGSHYALWMVPAVNAEQD